MGLLDWFRPAWKHSSADVRRQAVAALGAEDLHILKDVVRADPDASIRRLALGKIDDAALLSERAANDPDDALRTAAAERLDEGRLKAALEASDEASAQRALEAVRGDARLAEIACKGRAPVVRRAAAGRIADAATLAELVRRAPDNDVKQAALDKIPEPKLLKDLALHDAPRALQLRAIERLAELADVPSLETVAQRAQVKAVRAAAAERLRVLAPPKPPRNVKAEGKSEAEAQRARALAEAEERRRREVAAAREAEAQRTAAAAEARRAATSQADEEARRIEEARRAERAEADARRASERAAREAERAKKDAERDAERAKRDAERAEREAARADEERRFTEAARPVVERLAAVVETEDTKEGRKALDEALKAARDLTPLRGRVGPEAEEVRARFDDLRGRAAARLNELRDAESWRRWANVPKFEALIARAEALLANAELDARARATELKGLQAEWKALGAAPRERADALWAKFKTAADEIHARTQEGFAALDEQRGANLEKKKELVARAEALADSTDWKATAEALKALQEEWKAIGPVPKEEAEAIWEKFRTACDRFFDRRKAVFAEQEGARIENLAKLVKLCERAEALKLSTDWRGTADALKALQAEWKAIGPAGKTRAEADEVWQRFRGACDAFFERRKAAFAAEDEKRQANLVKKEALVARAEALAGEGEQADPDTTIRGLMNDWKAAGPVPREQADALWDRFRAACDKIRNPEPYTPEAAEGADAEGARFSNRALEGLTDKLPR
jgi:hypothetical protein